ncbi:c-type cytochrome [Stenotrophomonas sp. GZD-301]|uniref:c-type cytochrome n=1 Tax=Stenotrophomonas sp. GZD-301 TaxID=3404814 RepID=UPI003BB65CFB
MVRWKKISLAVALVAAAVLATLAWTRLNTKRSVVANDTVTLAQVRGADRAAVARGAYVMRTGDCMACHSAGQGEFAGGYNIDTPFGRIVSSNITPDPETGIGAMTEREFFNAVRHGQGSKGLLYPAMPYTAYQRLTDQDMHDLWAYMSTVAPVHNKIEETAGLGFPVNIRLVMAGWNLLFFDNRPFTPTPGLSIEQTRGQYLVDGGTHCAACHSPRNLLGAESGKGYMQGGNLGLWYAPDLTPNPHTGLGGASEDSVVEYLQTGSNGVAVATGPMAEAVEHSFQHLEESDIRSIARYLQTLPASPGTRPKAIAQDTPAMQRGALRYEVNCSACHGVRGEGMGGMTAAFAGNRSLQSDDATSLMHVMLVGGRAAATDAKPTGAGMPSFAWKMSDRQIAETLDYIRNSWGNAAKPVDEAEVARLRAVLSARDQLPAN